MQTRKYSLARDSRGQSLVETALMIPLLLVLILNAVNFGYFLLVTPCRALAGDCPLDCPAAECRMARRPALGGD